MSAAQARTRVSIVATPTSMVSPVSGLYEALSTVGRFRTPARHDAPEPFAVEVVAARAGLLEAESGLAITAHRALAEVTETDIVVVPSMAFDEGSRWLPGREPRVVEWIRRMHAGGAAVCTACTGGMLAAETGLLDGEEATVHWVSEADFRRRHPSVVLRPDRTLVVAGEGGRLVTSGAATAWHDLALYIVARWVGPATAQSLARFQLIQWHSDGQEAFGLFDPPLDHGDAAVLSAQRWIAENHPVASPAEEMAKRAQLAPATFKRRFKAATGLTPIAYAQRIRVDRAKRLLETGDEPVERIAWAVGYEDPASFRRLFKRLAGLPPGEYRRRFRMPDLPHIGTAQAGESGALDTP
jgi:transcriptional regulator GlxA family with amidase domain